MSFAPQNSVTRSAPINSDSQGRCGTRFLTTYDRRFVIKTVSSEDVAEMHSILKKYHQVQPVTHSDHGLPAYTGRAGCFHQSEETAGSRVWGWTVP